MNPLLALEQVQTRPERFRLRFPVGVFGTLRRGQSNASLMAGYQSYRRGFLPHFVAEGYRLWHRRGAAAAFEIYEFGEADWPTVMARLDGLEEFTPEAEAAGDYHRTLMAVTPLPDEFAHPLFDAAELLTPNSPERDLAIPKGDWRIRESVACWVYSSPGENARSVEFGDSPVLWW
jgi:gamma-glutamylcyclotransferase (GGCT)/AIG2-like uncharacterized protein YtfP